MSGRSSVPDRFTPPVFPTSAALRRESRHFPGPHQTSPQPRRPEVHSVPQWHTPVYNEPVRIGADTDSLEEFPIRRACRVPVAPDERRDSDASNATLYEDRDNNPYTKYSLSSYAHPYDIPPPPGAYPSPRVSAPPPLRSALRRSVSFAENHRVQEYEPDNRNNDRDDHESDDGDQERQMKRRGILSNYLDLYALDHSDPQPEDPVKPRRRLNRMQSGTDSEYSTGYTAPPNKFRRADSMASMGSLGSDMYDADDPRVTGIKKEYLDDQEDLEKNALRQMDYKTRRKVRQRIRIEFNICCESLSLPLSNEQS